MSTTRKHVKKAEYEKVAQLIDLVGMSKAAEYTGRSYGTIYRIKNSKDYADFKAPAPKVEEAKPSREVKVDVNKQILAELQVQTTHLVDIKHQLSALSNTQVVKRWKL